MSRTYFQDPWSRDWHSTDCEGDERQGGGGCSTHCPSTALLQGYPIRCDLLGSCDEPHYHFETLDQLRDWLTDTFREDGVPIDCREPYPLHGSWKDADDAEGWLAQWDAQEERGAVAGMIWERAAERAGVKL